jgi:hypothetical protein
MARFSLSSLRAPRRARHSAICLIAFALSALVLPAFSPRACAYMRIAEDSPHAALLHRVYDHLPDLWKHTRYVVVQEVSDEEMDRLVAEQEGDSRSDDSSSVDGCYQGGGDNTADPAVITLRETLSGSEAAFVFAHEYGHLLWDEFLNRQDRARYAQIWREQKRAGKLVTDYAAVSDEEGFAESFGHFARRPALLRQRDLRSWKFLCALLGQRDHASTARSDRRG